MSISPFENERDYQAADPFRNGASAPAPEAEAEADLPTWTEDDQRTAFSRGWGIFEAPEHAPIIRAIGDLFGSDQAACRHVRENQTHSPLCRKAMLFLGVAQRAWFEEHKEAA